MNYSSIWSVGYAMTASFFLVILLIAPIVKEFNDRAGDLFGISRVKFNLKKIPRLQNELRSSAPICSNSLIAATAYNFYNGVEIWKEEIKIIFSSGKLGYESNFLPLKHSRKAFFVSTDPYSIFLTVGRAFAHCFKSIFLPSPCGMGRSGHFGFHSLNCSMDSPNCYCILEAVLEE